MLPRYSTLSMIGLDEVGRGLAVSLEDKRAGKTLSRSDYNHETDHYGAGTMTDIHRRRPTSFEHRRVRPNQKHG